MIDGAYYLAQNFNLYYDAPQIPFFMILYQVFPSEIGTLTLAYKGEDITLLQGSLSRHDVNTYLTSDLDASYHTTSTGNDNSLSFTIQNGTFVFEKGEENVEAVCLKINDTYFLVHYETEILSYVVDYQLLPDENDALRVVLPGFTEKSISIFYKD